MTDDHLSQVRRDEYRLRRRAEALRARVYTQLDPGADGALAEALAAAEMALSAARVARRAAEQAAGRGVLLAPAGVGPAGGALMGADTTGIEAEILLRLAHVPTGIVHLLDPARTPLVTYRLRYVGRSFVRLRLTTRVEGYSAACASTVELASDQAVEIPHLPTFFPERLAAVTELTRATLHLSIDDLDAHTEQENTFPIWLLARTSAYNGVEDAATGQWVDLSAYFGAWVTPNAPAVMGLLRRAAELHPEGVIVGYQGGVAEIEAQVAAAFAALKAQGIVYVNSVLALGATKGEYLQRVRLPREALLMRSANCLDGTVLLASVLEAASLNPALVLVPGHAFLAWETQDGNGEWDYLETTMIGTHDFAAARAAGRAEAVRWQETRRKSGDPSHFTLLPLPYLRAELGVSPME